MPIASPTDAAAEFKLTVVEKLFQLWNAIARVYQVAVLADCRSMSRDTGQEYYLCHCMATITCAPRCARVAGWRHQRCLLPL